MLKQFFCLCTIATLTAFSSYADISDENTSNLACKYDTKKDDNKNYDNQSKIACDCHTDPNNDKKDDNKTEIACDCHSDQTKDNKDDNKTEIACKHKKSKKASHHDNEQDHKYDDQAKIAACNDGMCTIDEENAENKKIA